MHSLLLPALARSGRPGRETGAAGSRICPFSLCWKCILLGRMGPWELPSSAEAAPVFGTSPWSKGASLLSTKPGLGQCGQKGLRFGEPSPETWRLRPSWQTWSDARAKAALQERSCVPPTLQLWPRGGRRAQGALVRCRGRGLERSCDAAPDAAGKRPVPAREQPPSRPGCAATDLPLRKC